MMLQYLDIKKRHEDCVLFYRLGDFYEMFFDDALLVSKLLELTLTGRDCGLSERAPMCGVPYHSASTYIARLVALGYKVAICEQTSDPATSKGLVTRDVVRIITPGTVVDLAMLDEKTANYILCIAFVRKGASLCYADVSTGELVAHAVADAEKSLRDEIARINPHEIITNDIEQLQNYLPRALSVSALPSTAFTLSQASRTIKEHFHVLTLTSLGLEEKDVRATATGAMLRYLQDTQKNSLAHITHVTCYQNTATMQLDRTTRRNLELTESLRHQERKGSLLWLLDKTNTAMGSRLLRSWVENPLLDAEAITLRLNAVEVFYNDLLLACELQEALGSVADMERILSKISYGNLTARDTLALLRSLRAVTPIHALLETVTTEAIVLLVRSLTPLDSLCELLDSAIHPNAPLSMGEGGIIQDGYNAQLDAYREATLHGKQWILDMETAQRQATGIKNLKIQYNRVFGYYIEVTKSQIGLVPLTYTRKQTLANCERYTIPELHEIEKKISEAQQSSLALETALFSEIKDKIASEMGALQQNALALKTIDTLLSLATVAREHGYVKPTLHNDGVLSIVEGRHPTVEAMMTEGNFIANDSHLDSEDNRMLIITGPNMAGKSTYMRQVALLTLMAQMGSFVPAKEAHLCICDRVFTRIGASDDVASGQSTFMVEMSETAGILQSATKESLIILDEIGRGTSTFDGLAIAWAVVEHVVKKIGAKTLFATHYHELSELEGHLEGVKNYCISVTEQGEDVIFLRKIIAGGANKSYGVHVARLAGIPHSVVARASEIGARLEANDITQGNISSQILEKKKKNDKQIDFFHMKQENLIEELQAIDVLSMTPLQALDLLFRLREKARQL